MKKLFILLTMLIVGIGSMWADINYFLTEKTAVTSVTSGKYYVFDGINQLKASGHFLFDDGTKVTSNNPQQLPGNGLELGKFVWKVVGNATDGYSLQNLATGHYMSLGSSNGSQISSSTTPQYNGIYFGNVDDVTYATIRNSNGQAIDIGAYGNNPTTWTGNTEPSGSRRLLVYEVNVVEIVDDACYTLDFISCDESQTWGLKSGITEQAPVLNGTGDVFVAHSYTNLAGEKRWIFVNNTDGSFLAYHGQANATFNIEYAINEWKIANLTTGQYVSGTNLAGKLCITNDRRYTDNASEGCYVVKESESLYNNTGGPLYYKNGFTSAIRFNATGDAVSSKASLAIARFEALNEVRGYLKYTGNISALFADPSSIESNINAAATAEAAATIATNFMKSPEGKKFYIQNDAKSRYLTVGSSVLSATSTTLTADEVMEVEYAGNQKYYLKGIFRNTYVCTPNQSSNISTTASKGSAETFYIGNQENNTDNKVYFSNKYSSSGNYGAIHYSSGYTYQVVGWTYNSSNSQWHITAVSDAKYTELCNATCDVTYNAILEASGTVKATATTLNATRGNELAVPSSLQRDYCTYKFYSDAACTNQITTVPNAATTTVFILVSYTPPFTLSANFESATWYYATLRGKYLRADEDHKDDNGRYQTNSTNERTDVYKWAFVGNPYELSIINKGAGSSKVLYAGDAPVMQAATPASDNKARWVVSPNSNGGFTVRSESGANLYINDAGNGGNLGYWNSGWGANDAGSNWLIEVPTVDVTYKMMFNDSEIKSVVVSENIGATASTPSAWTVPAYCSFTCPSTTITAETTEIEVTLNWDGPFDISSDFEHAKWRYLKMHGQYLIYSGSSTTPNSLDDLATAEDAGYNAFWAFVGDPFNGFQLINKAAGSDKNLAVTGWYPNMDTSETKWLLQQWGNYFALRTSSYYYLNNADGQLKLWVSGSSAEATNFDCEIESASYRGLALDFIDEYANSHALGQYFGVSTSTYNSVRASYADAASVSESDYTQLVTYIGGMLPASYPETGYYRIKSNSGRYIGYGQPVADPMPSVGLRTVSAEDAAKDVSTIFRLVKGVGNHQYTLSTEGLNVQSMKSSNTPFPATNDVGATFVLTASTTNPGKGTIYNAASNDDGSEYINGYLHEANGSVPGVINWHAGSTSSQWEIEDATSFSGTLTNANDNTGTGHSYATLCVPFAISSITGASAYAPKKDGNYLVMGNALESTIAAGTPVMLVGATNAGSYTANIEANTAPVSSPIDTYALKGTFTGTSIDCTKQTGTNYVLGFDRDNDNRIGFYHVNSSSYSLKANRAYLNLTGGDARGYNIMFDVDDDATGIVSTPGETEEGTTIYNLSGQRLNKMQKGINIVNGKKVLF